MQSTPAAVHVITTGGTIDKVYFDALSAFEVGETSVGAMLREANVTLPVEVEPLLRKDSLDLTDHDRTAIRAAVERTAASHILITHGTDTMPITARALVGIAGKTIVLTGAMLPASQRRSDAMFNIGFALAAVQTLPPGVWIAINGRLLDGARAVKDRANIRFVEG